MAYIIEALPQPPFDLFVPADEEIKYLKKYGVEVDSLHNGATLVSRFVRSSTTYESEVRFEFPTGSYYDPKGKEGILHFVEHLIANRPLLVALKSGAKLEAWTSSELLKFETSGVANKSVKRYGIWPVIPVLLEELTNPNIMSYDLDRERKVIEAEIIDVMSNHRRRLGKAFNEILLSPDHPENSDVAGNLESIRSFDFLDVIDVRKRALTPKGLYVYTNVYGSKESYRDIKSSVLDSVGAMEGSDPQVVTDDILNNFNKELIPGSIFHKDISLKNGTIDLNYIWKFPYEFWSKEQTAATQLANLLGKRLHEYSRRIGLSYSTHFHNYVKGHTRILGVNITVPKVHDHEALSKFVFEGVKKTVFEELSAGDIEDAIDLYNLRQQAVPISTKRRLEDISRGLRYHGKIIDTEKDKKSRENIAQKDMVMWRDKFLFIEPATIVIGDLS